MKKTAYNYKELIILIKKYKDLKFPEQGVSIEIKKHQKKRSITQNKALHLYFKFISDELNGLGLTFHFKGIKGLKIDISYTSEIVKEVVFRPIMLTLFNKKSTTELTTKEIDKLITIINKFFAEKGVFVEFPSLKSLIDKIKRNERF